MRGETFQCDGVEYDTANLICPAVRDTYAMGVYITKDYKCLFAGFVMREQGLIIRRMRGVMLEMLAERTGHPDILRAFAEDGGEEPPPPAPPTPLEHSPPPAS